MQILKNPIFSFCLLFFVILFFIEKCNNFKHEEKLLHDVSVYKDTVRYFTDKYNHQVAYNATLALDNKKQIEDLLSKNKELVSLVDKYKTINTVTVIKNVLQLVHDTVLYPNLIPCPELDQNPLRVNKKDSLYYLTETIHSKYFTIDTLQVINTQSVVTGIKKTGWFKSELRTEVINSNPLIRTIGIQSYITQIPPKAWYERPLVLGIIGIGVGWVLHK